MTMVGFIVVLVFAVGTTIALARLLGAIQSRAEVQVTETQEAVPPEVLRYQENSDVIVPTIFRRPEGNGSQ